MDAELAGDADVDLHGDALVVAPGYVYATGSAAEAQGGMSELQLFDARQYDAPWVNPSPPECLDCGVDTIEIDEYYSVNGEVWLAANPADAGFLCIGCLEGRLGRRLSRADFTACPVNKSNELSGSTRLMNRLRAA